MANSNDPTACEHEPEPTMEKLQDCATDTLGILRITKQEIKSGMTRISRKIEALDSKVNKITVELKAEVRRHVDVCLAEFLEEMKSRSATKPNQTRATVSFRKQPSRSRSTVPPPRLRDTSH